jgi:hypothetical protein
MMPDQNVPRRTFLKLAGLGAAGAALNQTMPKLNGRYAGDLPDYAPVPKSALGPALNAQGYYVGRVEKNLYWVTDATYQCAFLTTKDGVVVLDAPPTIGHNIQRAIDEIAAANGVSNKVKYLIYTHHHADHGGASSLFGKNITRIGHEETRKLLIRDNDKARPAPEEIFQDKRTLNIGGSRIELAWHGTNHSPGILQHFLLRQGPDRYLSLGYRFDTQVPNGPSGNAFGYNGNAPKATPTTLIGADTVKLPVLLALKVRLPVPVIAIRPAQWNSKSTACRNDSPKRSATC